VLSRRWVVDPKSPSLRTFAWLGRCRSERKRESVFRLAKDFERTLASSVAWVKLAACRFMMRRVARCRLVVTFPPKTGPLELEFSTFSLTKEED